ncbi:unnamed protein product [Lota lota]
MTRSLNCIEPQLMPPDRAPSPISSGASVCQPTFLAEATTPTSILHHLHTLKPPLLIPYPHPPSTTSTNITFTLHTTSSPYNSTLSPTPTTHLSTPTLHPYHPPPPPPRTTPQRAIHTAWTMTKLNTFNRSLEEFSTMDSNHSKTDQVIDNQGYSIQLVLDCQWGTQENGKQQVALKWMLS